MFLRDLERSRCERWNSQYGHCVDKAMSYWQMSGRCIASSSNQLLRVADHRSSPPWLKASAPRTPPILRPSFPGQLPGLIGELIVAKVNAMRIFIDTQIPRGITSNNQPAAAAALSDDHPTVLTPVEANPMPRDLTAGKPDGLRCFRPRQIQA